MLKKVLADNLVDYLAMDIKSDERHYEKASGVKINFGKIKESVKIIMESNVPYEFRTTCVPGFIDEEAIKNIGEIISGARAWYLQRFKSDAEMIDHSLEGRPAFTEKQMKDMALIGGEAVTICQLRG
jgi:pyruvate formate lyase activating enzyme